MAYKLIWSPAARDDLHDIVVFISRDNPQRAMAFGYRLISETDNLANFPRWAGWYPNFGIKLFEKLSFGPIESCIA